MHSSLEPPDPRPQAPAPRPTWDVFVRVIDNRGDAGVSWRLARHLALRSQRVRLWMDDPGALRGMADARDAALVREGAIEVGDWPPDTAAFSLPSEGVAVVEAFGCSLPEGVQVAIARARQAAPGPEPVWINLEYLSAEPYVERSHGLPSPRGSGPAAGAITWFFYPGFTERTGGLLLDAEPAGSPQAPPPDDASRSGGPRSPLRISRFDYGRPESVGWLERWADALARRAPGSGLECIEPGASNPASRDLGRPEGPSAASPALRRIALPWLSQSAYDSLLVGCELNIVRGEDSFVRAQWAGRPMVWQIYPQEDGVHAVKLQAWLDLYLAGCDADLGRVVRQVHALWNGLTPDDRTPNDFAARCLEPLDRPLLARWTQHAGRWRDGLGSRPDLATALIRFVHERQSHGSAAAG